MKNRRFRERWFGVVNFVRGAALELPEMHMGLKS